MSRRRLKKQQNSKICPLTGEYCSGSDCALWDSYYQRCLIASALITIKFLGRQKKQNRKEEEE